MRVHFPPADSPSPSSSTSKENGAAEGEVGQSEAAEAGPRMAADVLAFQKKDAALIILFMLVLYLALFK